MADRLEFDVSLNGNEAQSLIRTLADDLAKAGKSFNESVDFSTAAQQAKSVVDALDFSNATDQLKGLGDALDPQVASNFADAVKGAADSSAVIGTNLDPASAANLTEELVKAGSSAGSLAVDTGTAATFLADAANVSGDVATSLGDAATSANEAGTAFGNMAESSGQSANHIKDNKEQQAGHNEQLSQANLLMESLKEKLTESGEKGAEVFGPLGNFVSKAVKDIGEIEGKFGVLGSGATAGVATFLVAGEEWAGLTAQISRSTGATGEALTGMTESFDKILAVSNRAPAEIAQTFSTLSGDLGITGDELESATKKTEAFLQATGANAGSVRTLTQDMVQLGIGTEGLGAFLDNVTAASTHFGVSADRLLSEVKQVGSGFQALGLSQSESVGMIAMFDRAGINVNRLSSGLTKIEQQASGEGITGREKLKELFDNVTHATDATTALDAVQGIWSGRTAQQVVAGIRSQKIGFDELTAAMADSSGKTEAVAKSTETLGTVFGGIRDKFLAAIGPFGHEMAETLQKGIEGLTPVFTSLFDVVKELGPVFNGLMTIGLGPLGLLLTGVIGPALHVLVEALKLIPGPVKEAAGGLIALKIAGSLGLFDMIGGLARGFKDLVVVTGELVVEEGVAAVATETFGIAVAGAEAAITALNPVLLVAGAALLAFTFWQHSSKEGAKELKDGVDALNKSLGDTAAFSVEGFNKVQEKIAQGSIGKLVTDDDLKRAAQLGLSIDTITHLAILPPGGEDTFFKRIAQDSELTTDQINKLIDSEDQLKGGDKIRLKALAAKDASAAMLELLTLQTTVTDGASSSLISGNTRKAAEAWRDSLSNVNNELKTQAFDSLTAQVAAGDLSAAQIKAARDLHGTGALTKDTALQIKGSLDEIHNAEARAAEGITNAAGATAQEIEEVGKANIILKDKKLGVDDVAKAERDHVSVTNALIDAERKHVITNQDLFDIHKRLGVSIEDVAKDYQNLKTVEEDLLGVNTRLAGATEIYFNQLSAGIDPLTALRNASELTGVSQDTLEKNVKGLTQSIVDLYEPFKASDAVLSAIGRDMANGAGETKALADAMNLLGGDQNKAVKVLQDFKKETDDAAKSIKDLVPTLAALNDQATNPAKGTSSLKVWEDETTAVEANTAARLLNVNTAIQRTQGEKDDLLAADPHADTTALDERLRQLNVDKDKIIANGKEAVKGVRDSMDNAAKEVPGSLARIIDDGMAAAATRFNDAKTIEDLTRAGGTNLLKLIFDPASAFSPAQRSKMLAEASHMSPDEFVAQEARAKDMYAGQQKADEEAIKAGGGLANVFKGVNPLFIQQSQEEGKANGLALVAGIAGGMAEAVKDGRITKLIQGLLRGGLTPEMVQEMFPEAFPGLKTSAKPEPVIPPNAALRAEQAGGDVVNDRKQINLHKFGEDAGGDYVRGFKDKIHDGPLTDKDIGALTDPPDLNLHKFGEDAGGDYSAGMKNKFLASRITEAEMQTLEAGYGPAWQGIGTVSGVQLHDEIQKQLGRPLDPAAFSDLVAAVAPVAETMGISVGEAFRNGVAAGIAKGQNATEAAFKMAHDAKGTVDVTLGNASPSKEMFKRGQWFVEGLAHGIDAHAPKAHAAATKMTDALTGIIGGTMGSPKILAQISGGPMSLGDGPGVDRIVRAIAGNRPVPPNARRRLPFGGNG